MTDDRNSENLPPGGQPQGGYPGYQPTQTLQQPRKPGRTALMAGALALALVSGGVGGAVGSMVTDNTLRGSAPASNALEAPKPATSPAISAPAGSVQAV